MPETPPPQPTPLSTAVPKKDRRFEVSLFIAFFLCVGIALILIWSLINIIPGHKQTIRKPFCCPDILDMIQPLLNYSFSPCDDMYNFVCQTITERSRWPGIPNVFYQAYSGLVPALHSMVYQGRNIDVGDLEGQPDSYAALGRLYYSCAATVRGDDNNQMAIQAAEFFNTWEAEQPSILEMLYRNPTDEELARLLIRLAIVYDARSVISVNFTILRGNSVLSSPLMVINLGVRFLSKLQTRSTFFNYTADQILNWTNTVRLHKSQSLIALQDVIDLADATNPNLFPETNVSTMTIDEFASCFPATITKEKLIAELSEALSPQLSFAGISGIQAVSAAALREVIGQLFRRRKQAVTYLLVHVIGRSMEQFLLLPRGSSEEDVAICKLPSGRFAELRNLAIVNLVRNATTVIEAGEMRAGIRNTVAAMVGTEALRAKINSINVHLAFANVFPEIAVPRMGSNLFLNVLKAQKYSRMIQVKRIVTKRERGQHVDGISKITYFSDENSVYISASNLYQPMYYTGAEPFVNYATTGMLLAGALFESVGYHGRGDWRDVKNESMEAQRKCFEDRLFPPNSKVSPAAYDNVLSISRALEAVWEIVHEDVKTFPNMEAAPWNMTRAQTFFIRFCQTWCGYDPDEQLNAWRCNIPVRRMAAFAEAFRCHGPKNNTCPSNAR